MNTEFQQIAWKDKKVFLSDQSKETEKNSRMGKPRDFFKKMRDTKGTFHAKTGPIKDRNGMEIKEAEDIKKRWQSCQSRFDARYWMLGAGALGRPRRMVWGGRGEEGSGWGTHVYLWRIHFDVWQS